MAELSNISLKQGGRQLENITLSSNQYPNKTKWVSLGAGAGINKEALVEALDQGDLGHVVGCMPGFESDPAIFIDKYPNQPAITFNTFDELKKVYSKNDSLAFYYPATPS